MEGPKGLDPSHTCLATGLWRLIICKESHAVLQKIGQHKRRDMTLCSSTALIKKRWITPFGSHAGAAKLSWPKADQLKQVFVIGWRALPRRFTDNIVGEWRCRLQSVMDPK